METFVWNWKSRDGLEMSARGWKPADPKAVVVLVHGHGEHIERYQHVAEAFATGGYAMQAFDLRGHGKSHGKRGYTPNYSNLMEDIADFVGDAQKRYPGLPVFLYGHSMGGNLAMNYVLQFPKGLKGAISTGPWLKLAFDPPAAQMMAVKLLDKLAPTFAIDSNLDAKGLSHDQEVVRKYQTDPLVHGKVTPRLYSGITLAGIWALTHAADLKIPMLLMHGAKDPITSPAASQEFAQKAGKLVTLRIWEGLFHEIHNEPEKAQVIEAMVSWMDQIL